MAQFAVLLAGLLLVASQASDNTDQSALRGSLSKYKKFITPTFSHVQNGNGPDADSMALTSAKDLNPVKIADREEKEAVQDLLANDSIKPITLSAIGVGLLSLVTVLGVRMWRGLQQTTVVASSGADMPSNSASALGDGLMEMKSQDPNINYSAAAFNSSQQMSSQMVGGGQMSSQNSPPLTLCYAEPPWAGEGNSEGGGNEGKAYVAGVAALAATAVVLGVDAELVTGAAIAGIVLGADKNRAFEDVTKSVGEVALSVGEPLIEKAGPKLLEAASAASDKAASAAKSSSSKSD
jgi:hypothetical protein